MESKIAADCVSQIFLKTAFGAAAGAILGIQILQRNAE